MKPPANDAHLIQLVRSRIGREVDLNTRINVSSCKMIVTLHGLVESEEAAQKIVGKVLSVPGVEGVEDKLRCNQPSFRT